MATQAHCAYCFECLSASLEKRRPLNLRQVERLWEKYDTACEGEDEDEQMEDIEDEIMDEDLDQTIVPDSSEDSSAPNYRPAAISRLLAPTPSSASSSSTPSTNSSTPSLQTSSSASRSNSRSFFSLGRRLRGKENKSVNRSSISEAEGEMSDHPLFVTWNTIHRSGNKNLRGCIGTFEAQELDDGLRSYALTSAFDDTRFSPIAIRELPHLEVAVTLLTDFEPAPGPLSWEIGKHGLRISFTSGGRRYGATYLPDVALEQGWSKEETVVSLMRKAGWGGRRDDWRKVDLNVIRYQGKKVTLSYRAWREWREWVEDSGRDPHV